MRGTPAGNLFAAAALGLALCAGPARADILIAAAGPMSGPDAPFGRQMKDGAEQAVADINAAGGVNGEMLRLQVADDGCGAARAAAVAGRLAGKGVVFVAGHFCSEASIAAAPVYAGHDIVQISPASPAPAYTERRAGAGTFRLGGRNDAEGAVAGGLLAARFPGRRVAFVDDGTLDGRGLSGAAMAAFEAAGGAPALRETYRATDADLDALAFRLQSEEIDALYLGGGTADAGRIALRLREQGLGTVLVSGSRLAAADFGDVAGAAANGTLMTALPDPAGRREAERVVRAMRASGRTSEGYALYAYAAVQAWAAAATIAGGTDYGAVAAALGGKGFDTVLGEISFDAKGDAPAPDYVLREWKDGKPRPLP